jgi:hypothetical protein
VRLLLRFLLNCRKLSIARSSATPRTVIPTPANSCRTWSSRNKSEWQSARSCATGKNGANPSHELSSFMSLPCTTKKSCEAFPAWMLVVGLLCLVVPRSSAQTQADSRAEKAARPPINVSKLRDVTPAASDAVTTDVGNTADGTVTPAKQGSRAGNFSRDPEAAANICIILLTRNIPPLRKREAEANCVAGSLAQGSCATCHRVPGCLGDWQLGTDCAAQSAARQLRLQSC